MTTKLLKSTLIVSLMTMLSRVLGLVRDIVFARYFGAGGVMDAFVVAFKIPNFLRRLFAEGAFSQAFVPVLSERRSNGSELEVRQLTDAVAGTLGGVLLLVTVIGVVAAPLFIMLFAPGFVGESDRFELATGMLRITFPYLLLISLTAFAGGILNTYSRFAIPAVTPVFLNLSMIAAAIWLSPMMEVPVTALAWGVLVGGVVQLLFQIPALLKLGMLPRPRFRWHDSGVRKIIKLMIPTLFGASVAQINLLLDLVIASLITAGSMSWLYYSDRLMEFPLGVFGIALSTVILPKLSGHFAEENHEAFNRTMDWALRLVVLIALPASAGLFLLAEPMLALLFQRGEFTAYDVDMAAVSLMAYSLGLVGFILVKVLINGYFSRQDTRTPVKYGLVAMVSNMGLNILFVGLMVQAEYGAPHAGLALATAGSSLLNAWLLYRGLQQRQVYRPLAGWRHHLLQVVLALTAMSLFLYWSGGLFEGWLDELLWYRIALLSGVIVAAAGIYFTVLYLFGMRSAQLRYDTVE
ncbi:MAG: murein biosynthesis integral membrane protein MurJ [Gammaproteobacteria bacterium]|nr:murein biosynthesis integral membrane protein MurJ [Gammaproteobacteria bacterium]MBT3489761.1 murein biosynthesis integral membrane protein MurJ [Gammaproteobacteria bacterium]MBT3719722.1 murein biosynthesis integral membrane protein MurJ [Gammaproteobacteria bacterium]MBT3845496.1 murein biosynthesis integral membrane protein MurJ [Gammaproteobacteria bacterium]MBT3892899.1 murein biosynthesis integral membrane protein MurJ [Gammaproteobacteria bacterium]